MLANLRVNEPLFPPPDNPIPVLTAVIELPPPLSPPPPPVIVILPDPRSD